MIVIWYTKLTCLKRDSFFCCPNHSVFLCHDIFMNSQMCVKKIGQVRVSELTVP